MKHRGRAPVSLTQVRKAIQGRTKLRELEGLAFELFEAAHGHALSSHARADMLRLLEKRLPDIFAPRNPGNVKGTSRGPHSTRRAQA